MQRVRQMQRAHHLLQVTPVFVESGAVGTRGFRAQQLIRDGEVPLAQLRDLLAHALVLALRQRHHAQQGVRDALCIRRQHHAQTSGRGGFEDGRHLSETVGVRDARPPELVHDPGSGLDHRDFRIK